MKAIWIVVISVVATVVIAGGGTYYLVNAKATKDKDNLQSQITDLNKKIDDSQVALVAAEATSAGTAATTTTVTPDPTAGWSTFSDATLGFSIKYPTTWTAEKSTQDSSMALYSTANPMTSGGTKLDNINIGFVTGSNTNYTNLNLYLKNIIKLTDTQISSAAVTVNGMTDYFVRSSNGAVDLYIQKNGTTNAGFYDVSFRSEAATSYSGLPSEERTMISTFQFLN